MAKKDNSHTDYHAYETDKSHRRHTRRAPDEHGARSTTGQTTPEPKKHVDSKGRPTHQVTDIPGYGSKGTGTPAWVAKPARAAERKAK